MFDEKKYDLRIEVNLSSLAIFNVLATPTDNNGSSDEVEFGSLKFFGLCGVGGILSCGITHTAIVPLDLIKCRIQVLVLKFSIPVIPLI